MLLPSMTLGFQPGQVGRPAHFSQGGQVPMAVCKSNILFLTQAMPGIACPSLHLLWGYTLSHFNVTGPIVEFSAVELISCGHIQTIVCLLLRHLEALLRLFAGWHWGSASWQQRLQPTSPVPQLPSCLIACSASVNLLGEASLGSEAYGKLLLGTQYFLSTSRKVAWVSTAARRETRRGRNERTMLGLKAQGS